jgi:hypothetical protein
MSSHECVVAPGPPQADRQSIVRPVTLMRAKEESETTKSTRVLRPNHVKAGLEKRAV